MAGFAATLRVAVMFALLVAGFVQTPQQVRVEARRQAQCKASDADCISGAPMNLLAEDDDDHPSSHVGVMVGPASEITNFIPSTPRGCARSNFSVRGLCDAAPGHGCVSNT